MFLWVKENLPRAKEQGAESAEQHRRKQNDAKAHTGNQVYSCGSLAPKLKKGGCSDCEVCVLLVYRVRVWDGEGRLGRVCEKEYNVAFCPLTFFCLLGMDVEVGSRNTMLIRRMARC